MMRVQQWRNMQKTQNITAGRFFTFLWRGYENFLQLLAKQKPQGFIYGQKMR